MPNVHNGGTRFSVGTGAKRFLGFVETDTENATVLTPFLRSLIERGLDLSQGVLVILDGGKGLRTAVRKALTLCAACVGFLVVALVAENLAWLADL